MVRKNFWLSGPVNELLRRRSYEERRSESDVIREALDLLLGAKR
jgi:Arc/MetJ-type ribon-helix-helix transcriptional regulator